MEQRRGLVRQSLNGGTCSHTDIFCPSTDRIAQLTLATTAAAEVTPGETWSEDVSRSGNQNFQHIIFSSRLPWLPPKNISQSAKRKLWTFVARNPLLKNENRKKFKVS